VKLAADEFDDMVAALKDYDAGDADKKKAGEDALVKLGYSTADVGDIATIATTEEGADSEFAVTKADGKAISSLIDNVDAMIKSVTTERSKLGAVQNRLEYTVKVDDNTAENLQSAESRIRDTDMADEMTKYSKESILQQAATSMLAQANQANQGVLSLLQ
ncbi:MAG: hypothetical protein J5988_12670, partial [Eubacterium sp.]|nr:hypothetical protein [Eubacterium sp.]